MAKLKIGDVLQPFDERLGSRAEPEILTLTEGRGFIPQSLRFNKRLAIEDTSGYKVVGLYDIAFNPYLLWAGAIAQNHYWEQAIISPAYPTFHVRKGFDPRFVSHRLASEPLLLRFDSISFGAVPRRRRAATEEFLELEFGDAPSLIEQRRIAAILDQSDALRAKRRKALDLLDELQRGMFIEMFGDPLTNPRGWPRKKFGELLEVPLRNGLSPSNSGSVHAKVLTLSAITGGTFDSSAVKTSTFAERPPTGVSVDARDFLICRGNGNLKLVGRGCFPHDSMPDVTFPDTMIAGRISERLIDRAFLTHQWALAAVRRQLESVARTTNGTHKVNQTVLEGISLLSPPLDLQRDFALRVRQVEGLVRTHSDAQECTNALFASLQHRAFRGEL